MSETNITGDVHGNVYSGNIGQIGDRHINTGGGNYYEGGTHHHHPDPLTWPLYINLPTPPTHFLGREDLLTTLIAQLRAGTTTALSAEGLPGVGKTTLAVKLAHHQEIRAHFTDGVLWAGLGPNGDPALALSRWADALQLDLSDKPTTAARAAAVADAISSRKLLIVLDDIWQLEHAKTLRLGGPNSVHLLTTRNQRIAAAFGHVATVDVLTPEAARELFRTLAPAAYNADPAAADRLLDAVGYLPLAIELLAGYLNAGASKRFASRTRQALDELTNPQRRLSLATRRLGSHESAAVTLQQTITLSLEGLAEEDETAVAIFHALGAFAPKPATFDLDAAIAVTGATEDTLALLADRNLLEIDQGEALSLHQTLADAARVETPAEAVTQHRDHYLALVNEDKEDWQTIAKIYPQIIHAWQHTPPDDPTHITFVDSLSTYQSRQGFWQDRLSWLEQALQVAKLTNDQRREASMLNNIGLVYADLGKKQDALRYYEQSLPLSRAVGDRAGEAATFNNIAMVYAAFDEKQEALRYYEQSLPLRRAVGDRAGEAQTLNNIGAVYAALGEKQDALRYFDQSLPLRRAVGDRAGEANTLSNIGAVYSALGEKQEALRYYEQALPLRRAVGDRAGEANTLNNMAAIYFDRGELPKAAQMLEGVIVTVAQIGAAPEEAASRFNMAFVQDQLGNLLAAITNLEQSTAILKRLSLNQDVGDVTLQQHEDLLAQLKTRRAQQQ
jgi:tetratricopeptide (TPR) repeat protein